MSENKKIENAIPEVKDDELDAVSGGIYDRVAHIVKCKLCGDDFPSTALFGGYCLSCLDALRSQGVYPPI